MLNKKPFVSTPTTERPYQVFASEEGAWEESAPEMSHLWVVSVLVNVVAEEEALLDSGDGGDKSKIINSGVSFYQRQGWQAQIGAL